MPQIKIDLSEWAMWGWSQEIEKLVKVSVSANAIEIKLDIGGNVYESVARKIATEAIEEFVGESMTYSFDGDGLTLTASNDDAITVGWDGLLMRQDAEGFKAAQAWLDSEFKEAIDDMPEDRVEEFRRKSGRA